MPPIPPDGFTFTGEEPEPTYRLMIRLVTDGELDAYADYATGFDPRELEWQAKAFLARYAHMLIGVDAFDREYIWQRFWMAQRFMYTGRGLLDTIDRMLWDLASRSCPPADLQAARSLPRKRPRLLQRRRSDH